MSLILLKASTKKITVWQNFTTRLLQFCIRATSVVLNFFIPSSPILKGIILETLRMRSLQRNGILMGPRYESPIYLLVLFKLWQVFTASFTVVLVEIEEMTFIRRENFVSIGLQKY